MIECDHGKLETDNLATTLGFKSMKTAYATIKGIEVMRALRKGQSLSILLWRIPGRNAPGKQSF